MKISFILCLKIPETLAVNRKRDIQDNLSSQKKRHITHIITDLDSGGAEESLYKLLKNIDSNVFKSDVISLTEQGTVGGKIEALGIPIKSLGMKSGVPNPLAILKLARYLYIHQSDIIQTWMYHADLIGGLAAKLGGNRPVVWNIRNTDLNSQRVKRMTIMIARLSAWLSHYLPEKIITNSKVAYEAHTRLGYCKEKMLVIPNGFDLDTYKPDPSARKTVRHELGLENEALLIGIFARFDPQKDHANFIQAAALLHKKYPETHFLLCGAEITRENKMLLQWIETSRLDACFHLLGQRNDIPLLTAALDIATLSSIGEAFPNVIGEAMACGIPCVATDAGDIAYIIGETGIIVSPSDSQALAKGWVQMIDLGYSGRRKLGAKARQRIQREFQIDKIVRQYESLYKSLT